MGVINITPNSFSDGGKNFSEVTLKKTLNDFLLHPNLILDFGFESTAPMNCAISYSEEKDRFDTFFLATKDFDFHNRWLSIDTYKIENFHYYFKQLRSRYPQCGIILNDVSGVRDQILFDLLMEYQFDSNFYYIFNNTHIPHRHDVVKHMSFVKEDEIIVSTIKNFENASIWFDQFLHLKKRVLFDVGFGFSKSFAQNWALINNLEQVINSFSNHTWVIGLSKKSFLRNGFIDSKDPIAESEVLHLELVKNIMTLSRSHIIFRVHDPNIALKAYSLVNSLV